MAEEGASGEHRWRIGGEGSVGEEASGVNLGSSGDDGRGRGS